MASENRAPDGGYGAHPGVGAIGYKGGMLDRLYRAQALLKLAGR